MLAAAPRVAVLHSSAHQNVAAGHAANSADGPLLGEGGVFLKPLPADDPRAERELQFYTRLNNGGGGGERLQRFLPPFRGVASLPAPAGGTEQLTYLALDDVTAELSRPCVADLKARFLCGYPPATPHHASARAARISYQRHYSVWRATCGQVRSKGRGQHQRLARLPPGGLPGLGAFAF
jgi:hypothetical protein